MTATLMSPWRDAGDDPRRVPGEAGSGGPSAGQGGVKKTDRGRRMHICLCANVLGVGHEEYEPASELFRILSAPLRLAIIDRLTSGPAAVHDLVAASGESQPLISQHLRVLRAAKLIRVQTYGRERVYSLTDEHVAHIVTDAIRHTGEPGTDQEEGNIP